jgi:hypothetical protein
VPPPLATLAPEDMALYHVGMLRARGGAAQCRKVGRSLWWATSAP